MIKVSSLSVFIVISLLLFSACSKVVDKQDSEHLSTAIEKPIGVTLEYNAPKDWEVTNQNGLTVYTAPEHDAAIVIAAIPEADNALAAATSAWKTYQPSFSREVRINAPQAVTGGWEVSREIEYVTSIAEEKLVYAYVFQANNSWQVILLDGKVGTFVKRQAATWGLIESASVKGYTPEDLSERQALSLTPEKVAELVSFVESSANSLDIPGVGIALVENGNVIYEGGVGIKNIHTKEPVDKDTLFMIASNTKGMTTLLLAKLVEMGKLNWDDQVVTHYPDFKLGDEKTTQSVLVKHLVCACTGLPRKDMDWVFNSGPNIPASATFNDLALTAPTSTFGELFQYNNQMAAAAGYVAAHILYPDMEIGAAYDKAMDEYIFAPLKMQDTTFSFAEALTGNVASPHGLDLSGNTQLIKQTATDGFNHTVTPYRPAGAAWSSPSDMIKYVYNELSAGLAPDGTRLYAAEPLLKRREPTVATGAESSYGMGLSNDKVSGIEIVEHGGSMAGYKSNFIAIPTANVGAVILTNSDEGYKLTTPFKRRLIELMYNSELQAENKVQVTVETTQLNAGKLLEEITYPPAPDIINNLADNYYSKELGELAVIKENEDVLLNPGVWETYTGTKASPDGTISLVTIAPFFLGGELVVGEENGLRTLTLLDAQHSYVFSEVTDK
ncbi:serine hydrolase domain-containing protein [Paraglaciecola marina]|uniref:serine hydrolase domain-containing protein n=1 Tax=Paraglaciecola marina TaxID=2500157 RepID=UPI00105F837C|nr:serine hydrolase domain-containing protein [Paraglaciecola marina]